MRVVSLLRGPMLASAIVFNALAASHVFAASVPTAAQDDVAWAALKRGNHVLLMRHAQTVPGVGDPPGFKLGDCNTQRNLSAEGRADAANWKAAIAVKGIPIGGVYASQWCRCVDTARLAFGKVDARVDTWPALNSHFDTPATAELQAAQVVGGLAVRMVKDRNLILVTHQVNIATLTGIAPASGEAVVAKFVDGKLLVVGRVKP